MDSKLEVPTQYELWQNFPNPFNPITKIIYGVPKPTRVTVKIFNTLGQEVATLVDEQKEAGYYSIQWNTNNISSGIYFYQMRAGNYIKTKKMLYLR